MFVSTTLQLISVLLVSHLSYGLKLGFPYGQQKVRGVNLGGWLVLESWMTPSLFDNIPDDRVVDEYTFGQYVAPDVASAALKKHWDTFITEEDFIAISAAGLNHVRLPVGYWAYDPDGPYISGQAEYVDKAVEWAGNHGIKVWIDLHGVPGSQNGFDNSGREGNVTWHKDPKNIERSLGVISQIAKRYSDKSDVVTGIQLVNEPASFVDQSIMGPLKQYFQDGYNAIRKPYGPKTQGNALVVLSDAFKPLKDWNGFMAYPGYDAVGMDKHIYQMFSKDTIGLDEAGHIAEACKQASALASFNTLWTFIGEWSPATTDCAGLNNKRGKGSRYDGTFEGWTRQGSCDNLSFDVSRFSDEYKTTLRKMFEAQTMTFEKHAAGWFMWSWKLEAAPEWSYSAGLKGGWIPQRPDDYKYPNICG